MGATGLGAAAYALQGAGSIATSATQASAIRSQADYQSKMAEQNARLEQIRADDATQRGELNAQSAGRETRQRVGAQRAAMAAQGVDANSGSAAAVQSSTEAMGALNETNIRNNAWREAWGYKVQSLNDTNQARFTRLAGENASRNTLLTGGLNALSSFGKAAYAGKDINLDDMFTVWDDGGTLHGHPG